MPSTAEDDNATTLLQHHACHSQRIRNGNSRLDGHSRNQQFLFQAQKTNNHSSNFCTICSRPCHHHHHQRVRTRTTAEDMKLVPKRIRTQNEDKTSQRKACKQRYLFHGRHASPKTQRNPNPSSPGFQKLQPPPFLFLPTGSRRKGTNPKINK